MPGVDLVPSYPANSFAAPRLAQQAASTFPPRRVVYTGRSWMGGPSGKCGLKEHAMVKRLFFIHRHGWAIHPGNVGSFDRHGLFDTKWAPISIE